MHGFVRLIIPIISWSVDRIKWVNACKVLKACPAHRKRWILLAIIVIVVVSNNISIIGKCVKCQTLPDACKFLINDYYDNNRVIVTIVITIWIKMGRKPN